MSDFLKECKKKHTEGKHDFVSELLLYTSVLEKLVDVKKIKESLSSKREGQKFSGNY